MDMSNVYGQFLWFKAFMAYSLLCLYGCLKNILIVHEKNTKEIIAVKTLVFICNKTHVDFHKTFASIFSA